MRIDDAPPELQEYLGILWRRKWSIAVIVAIAVAAALLYASRQTLVYQSSTELLVEPIPSYSGGQSPTPGLVVMEDERRVATSAEVTQMAATALEREEVAMGAVSVEGSEKSHTLLFTAVSDDPVSAQKTAEAFADSYLSFRRKNAFGDLAAAREPIEAQLAKLNKQVEVAQRQLSTASTDSQRTAAVTTLTNLLNQQSSLQGSLNQLVIPSRLRVGQVLQPALPGLPSGPSRSRSVALALFMGLTLGVGVAFVRDRLDQRVPSRHDLESLTGAPVLAVIPRRSWRNLGRLGKADTAAVDAAYKVLCRRILSATAQRQLTTLMVASPDEDKEKSVTTSKLAFALGEAGKSVIILAAEPGAPRLDDNISSYVGLIDGQGSSPGYDRSPVDSDQLDNPWLHLWFVAPGVSMVPLPDSPAVLGTAAVKGLIDELKKAADLVLVDASPILEMSDAWALAPAVDAVLCVTDGRRTRRGVIVDAMRELHRVGARVVGVVLTNSDHRDSHVGISLNGNSGGHRRPGERRTDQSPRQQP
jgi:Mrp family chromosome partitioning ATPase